MCVVCTRSCASDTDDKLDTTCTPIVAFALNRLIEAEGLLSCGVFGFEFADRERTTDGGVCESSEEPETDETDETEIPESLWSLSACFA